MGDFARRSLASYSVDTSYCFEAPEDTRTSLARVENLLDGFETVIYRNNAADFSISPEQITSAMLSDCRCLLISGTCLAQEPSRSAIFRALELVATAGCPVVLDVDYRPYSWGSAEERQQVHQDAARACDVIVGNDEEFAVMAGGVDLAQALRRGSAAAAMVMSAFGCASAMPNSVALEEFMASRQELIPDALFPL